MKVYAIIGDSSQIIDETKEPQCPAGHIEMKIQRPEGNYIAGEDGQWVEVEREAMPEPIIG